MAPIHLITHSDGTRIPKPGNKNIEMYVYFLKLDWTQDLAEKQQIGYSQNLG